MAESTARGGKRKGTPTLIVGCIALMTIIVMVWPQPAADAAIFVFWGLLTVAPMVIPGIFLAAWIVASGANSRVVNAFEGRTIRTVLLASLIGAITPVCGVTVLPMMVGLLNVGVPLAPIMAFWLSSPITDPAMLATTIATLGLSFALGKTIAAFCLGILGGALTAVFNNRLWAKKALRKNSLVRQLDVSHCCDELNYEPRIWQSEERVRLFSEQFWATSRLILICLVPAFTAEYVLNAMLSPDSLVAYVGEDQWWAIPVAVFVGAPAYIDGYAALPLVRGLLENGMSEGAAMSFLISGGVVSIWGAMAIAPVLKLKPFLLYLVLAILGSLLAGYAFQWWV